MKVFYKVRCKDGLVSEKIKFRFETTGIVSRGKIKQPAPADKLVKAVRFAPAGLKSDSNEIDLSAAFALEFR